jgi:hypothetical protein
MPGSNLRVAGILIDTPNNRITAASGFAIHGGELFLLALEDEV